MSHISTFSVSLSRHSKAGSESKDHLLGVCFPVSGPDVNFPLLYTFKNPREVREFVQCQVFLVPPVPAARNPEEAMCVTMQRKTRKASPVGCSIPESTSCLEGP